MNEATETMGEQLLFVPPGKVRCYIHEGVLRKDTPEEHVRQRAARSIVEEYGYDRRDLHAEFGVKVGSSRKRVDIAIFFPGKEHSQGHIFAIVEAKREDVKPTDRKEGIEQLKSYLAVCPNAKWGLWVGSELQAYEKAEDKTQPDGITFIESTDLPLKGESIPKRLSFSELVPATEGLRAVFKRAHNYIHVNQGLEKGSPSQFWQG